MNNKSIKGILVNFGNVIYSVLLVYVFWFACIGRRWGMGLRILVINRWTQFCISLNIFSKNCSPMIILLTKLRACGGLYGNNLSYLQKDFMKDLYRPLNGYRVDIAPGKCSYGGSYNFLYYRGLGLKHPQVIKSLRLNSFPIPAVGKITRQKEPTMEGTFLRYSLSRKQTKWGIKCVGLCLKPSLSVYFTQEKKVLIKTEQNCSSDHNARSECNRTWESFNYFMRSFSSKFSKLRLYFIAT